MIQNLPLSSFVRRKDVRAIDPATVTALASSIRDVGVINPIRVRAIGEQWQVVAGSHRLAAAKEAGLSELPCIVVEDDDLHAELAMIDENLCRAELSAAERSGQTARRKAIHEELHGSAKAIGARAANAVMGRGNDANENFAVAFTSDTAKLTGKSERAVQLDVQRGEKVSAEVLGMVQGTKLDTGAYLDKLKRLPASEQFAAADRDLKAEKAKERAPVKSAPKASRVEVDVKDRALRAAASIIADHLPFDEWDGLKANLYAAGMTKLADALANMTPVHSDISEAAA